MSDTITANRFSEAPPVNVVLGACHSANAAAIWNTIKQDGINSLIAFPDETDCEAVQAVLVEVLKEGNIVEFGAAREEREIIYLDDWIKDMQSDSGKYPIRTLCSVEESESFHKDLAKGPAQVPQSVMEKLLADFKMNL